MVVVEDGPTVTHGGMTHGAGWLAARQAGAEIVDPVPGLRPSSPLPMNATSSGDASPGLFPNPVGRPMRHPQRRAGGRGVSAPHRPVPADHQMPVAMRPLSDYAEGKAPAWLTADPSREHPLQQVTRADHTAERMIAVVVAPDSSPKQQGEPTWRAAPRNNGTFPA